MPNTSQSKPSPVTTTVPPCPPMASTRPNHNIYVFICRLSVNAGGVASQTLELRLRGQGSVELTLWSERPTHPSPARSPCPTVPPCPPTASTHPNRNMYAFICRLRVHAGGVASLTTGARAPGQLGALASAGRTANTNSPLGPLGASPDTQGASSDPAPQCIPYTGTPHVCAMRGWVRKGPWGPEVDALGATCLSVASKPLDRHGLSTPLELKLPQALHIHDPTNNAFLVA